MFLKNKKYKKIMVHAYKYNGWLYRTVEFPIIIKETPQFILLYLETKNTITIKNQKNSKKNSHYRYEYGKFWLFFKDRWFNIMISLLPDDWNFYVNIASPYIIEENALKYIDFDIDFKIASDNFYRIMDQEEYLEHKRQWKYSLTVEKNVKLAIKEIIELIKQNWFQNFFDYQIQPWTRRSRFKNKSK